MAKSKTKELVANMVGIAAMIRDRFQINCQRQHVNNWKKYNPPFPLADDGGRYNVEECFAWYEENILPKGGGENDKGLQLLAMEAEARTKIRNDERSAWEFERDRGEWIKRNAADRTIIGALKKYHAWVKGEIERSATNARYKKLIELGVAPHISTAFSKWDLSLARGIIDRIELKCVQSETENTQGNGI